MSLPVRGCVGGIGRARVALLEQQVCSKAPTMLGCPHAATASAARHEISKRADPAEQHCPQVIGGRQHRDGARRRGAQPIHAPDSGAQTVAPRGARGTGQRSLPANASTSREPNSQVQRRLTASSDCSGQRCCQGRGPAACPDGWTAEHRRAVVRPAAGRVPGDRRVGAQPPGSATVHGLYRGVIGNWPDRRQGSTRSTAGGGCRWSRDRMRRHGPERPTKKSLMRCSVSGAVVVMRRTARLAVTVGTGRRTRIWPSRHI